MVGDALKTVLGLNVILQGMIQLDENRARLFGSDRNVTNMVEYAIDDHFPMSWWMKIDQGKKNMT